MGVKLFRATEFAESQGFEPGPQRRAPHPLWLVTFCAFWIAVPGNWLLWQSLGLAGGIDGPRAGWLALRLALLLAASIAALLCLLAWRPTLRPAATLALAITALASLLAAGQGQWRIGLALPCIGLLLLLPAWLVWRVRWRRLTAWQQLRLSLGGALACALAALLLLALSYRDLSALHAQAPWLLRLAVPFGPAGASARVEQILLRRQP